MNLTKLIPSGSQTVGPYFRIGLEYLVDQEPPGYLGLDSIELRGKVMDGDGARVSDAMLEFWGADSLGEYSGVTPNSSGQPIGFHRVATDDDGNFTLALDKPGPTALGDSQFQAPHLLVLVFARGLLRHLITRVYFGNEPGNAEDPVLIEVPAERRHTLIASSDASNPRLFLWNVILQGENETVFFAW